MASKLVLVLVFLFDLIAFGLAVAAERRRSTAEIEKNANQEAYCRYDSDISTGFGVGAFLFLLASQLLIMVASRCLCCGKGLSPGSSRAWAVILFLICWITFFIAEVCLLAGSVRNAYHTKYRTLWSANNPLSCQTLRQGVFGAGAAFIVFTGIISELYYVSFSRANFSNTNHGARDTGIRMGAL
uniref:Fiber protein Fb34 n=1 Tax=Kalanchoe fedtschenkoi TaxID=63787 RepID=A0A7N1A430_KALFE